MTLTVLIIGGYGTFGGRLCQLLADEAAMVEPADPGRAGMMLAGAAMVGLSMVWRSHQFFVVHARQEAVQRITASFAEVAKQAGKD